KYGGLTTVTLSYHVKDNPFTISAHCISHRLFASVSRRCIPTRSEPPRTKLSNPLRSQLAIPPKRCHQGALERPPRKLHAHELAQRLASGHAAQRTCRRGRRVAAAATRRPGL